MLRAALPLLALTMVCVFNVPAARAELPHVSYIFPAGGQRGQTVEFRVGGHFLHEGCSFEMTGNGVSTSPRIERTGTIWFEGPVIPMPASQRAEDYPQDYLGSVAIDADADLGLRYWRVWTSQGMTSRMKFVVGDLPEVIEHEIDGLPIPEHVNLPVTINGRIFPREDVDVWTFDAQKGETLTCEVMAARLGSPLDSRIEIRGPNGQPIVENVDAFGTDSFVAFTAPEAGTYECHIHDIEFGGLQHYVYRLTIRSGAYIRSVYPLGGKQGSEVHLTLSGDSLTQGSAIASISDAATDFVVWQSAPQSLPVLLAAGSSEELLEQEPNNDFGASKPALVATLPVVCNGRIEATGDVDLWTFQASKDQRLVFDVAAEQLGSPLDSELIIVDAKGQELASNKDASNGTADARLIWKAPADGHFAVQIRDELASRGGSDFAYRLSISEQPNDGFKLSLPSDCVTVDRGGETKLKIAVDRSLGWNGVIELSVDGLPEGVTTEGTTIAKNRKDTQLVLKAAEASPLGLADIRITGQAVDSEVPIEAEAKFATAFGEPAIDGLTLCVAVPTPFRFYAPFETKYGARGSAFTRSYEIDRGGFEGPIEIELADRQTRHLQGVTGQKVIVPPGESRFDFTIALPPWMEVGRTSRTCLMASAWIENEAGKRHRVSYTSTAQDDQIIVLVDPTRLSIETTQPTVAFSDGGSGTVDLPFRIARGAGLTGPVKVRLTGPSHFTGWTASEVEVPTESGIGTLKLTFDSDAGPFNMPLTLKAEMRDERRQPVVAECPVEVRMNAGMAKQGVATGSRNPGCER
ncbi:hypothetical protein GC176_17310 [bacterium]|nr:hypothetical protein [bacterium]